MRIRSATLLLLFASMSSTFVSYFAYDPGDQARRSDTFSRWIFPLVFTNWIISDARSRNRRLFYDYDTFMFYAWPLLAPLYLIQTRGWRVLWTLLGFVCIGLIAVVEWAVLETFFPRDFPL